MNVSPRRTMYVPTTAQTMPTIADASECADEELVLERLGQSGHGAPPFTGTAPTGRVRIVVMLLAGGRGVVVVGVVEEHGLTLEDEQVAAIGSREDVGVEHERGRAVGDDPPIDADDPPEVLGGRRKVVGGREDRAPPLRLGVEDGHQVFLRRRVDPGHGLVEQVQVGFRCERPSEERPPTLAARERPDLGPGVRGHPHLFQRCAHGLAIAAAGAPERPEPRITTHHRDVPHADREAPVDQFGLRDVGDPVRGAAGWAPEDRYLARPRAQHSRDHLEQRRLAATVGSEDRDEGPGIDLERHVLEGGAAVVADPDVRKRDRGTRDGCGRLVRADARRDRGHAGPRAGTFGCRAAHDGHSPNNSRRWALTVNPVRSAMRATTSVIPESSTSADRPHDEHTTWWWCRASHAT